MSRQTSKPTSPFTALQVAVNKVHQPPTYADGWRSVEEIAAEMNLSVSRVAHLLTSWRRAGLVETWEGYCGEPKRVRTARYRVKK